MAASVRTPGVIWGHNDSGDGPFIYCMDPSGKGCGLWRLDGAEAIDWEDIAAAPDDEGRDSLYVGDVGDNDRVRPSISIYRVAEPSVETRPGASSSEPTGSLDAERFDLAYPGAPRDAEAILVDRDGGDLYVITKEYSIRSEVFVARAPLTDGTELERVTTLKIPGLLSARTGASLSPDGTRVVLSTYGDGYELVLPPGQPFETIWAQEPKPIDLGDHEQGEAVTYTSDGSRILSSSEGAGSPIYAVERAD